MAWVAPRTWGTNEALTAAKMNEISSSLHAVGDPWIAYAPVWDVVSGTSPSVGNGSLTGAYVLAGKTVDFRIVLIIGSSTTMGTTAYKFTLPFTAGTAYPVHSPVGRATLLDNSSGTVYGRSAMLLSVFNLVLRDEGGTAVNGTTPVTIASGDRLVITGRYEAA